ncbi:MAG: hypothetical protein J6N56_03800 [Bacteroidales bacterium]|nr:hypothetical protein [Bacteroidales bacterium]
MEKFIILTKMAKSSICTNKVWLFVFIIVLFSSKCSVYIKQYPPKTTLENRISNADMQFQDEYILKNIQIYLYNEKVDNIYMDIQDSVLVNILYASLLPQINIPRIRVIYSLYTMKNNERMNYEDFTNIIYRLFKSSIKYINNNIDSIKDIPSQHQATYCFIENNVSLRSINLCTINHINKTTILYIWGESDYCFLFALLNIDDNITIRNKRRRLLGNYYIENKNKASLFLQISENKDFREIATIGIDKQRRMYLIHNDIKTFIDENNFNNLINNTIEQVK